MTTTFEKMKTVLDSMSKVKILCVGDIMLDRFVYGDVNRISPESPVPVLSIHKEKQMPGGVGNTLKNLASLGAQTAVVTIVGEDNDALTLREMLAELKVGASGIIGDKSRPTSVKIRYLAQNQQLLRSDYERTTELTREIEQKIVLMIEDMAPEYDAIIISDYGKGLLTKRLTQKIIRAGRKSDIPVLVDPKGSDYRKYKGAYTMTPNRDELSKALGGVQTKSDEEIIEAGQKLIDKFDLKALVATRSEDGMTVLRKGSMLGSGLPPIHIPTQALEVFDVSGAGDTVIATLAAALATGTDIETAARLANYAGGIVVGKVGTAAIRYDDLLEKIEEESIFAGAGKMAPSIASQKKIAGNWETAREQVERWQSKGLKVGFTNGCFDILHAGHVQYLERAKAKCDRLVLGLNSDSSVRLLKGEDRPVNTESSRAAVMAGLASVDLVSVFGAAEEGEDNTASGLIGHIKPDLYFKGGDYKIEDIPEAKVVAEYGGKSEIMPFLDDHSTTKIIGKITKEKAA